MKLLSLVIIVKNDFRIDNLLYKLKTINSPIKFETIVVDSSNGLLKEIKNTYLNVKWIHFKTGNKERTYPEQRNIGIQNAKGDIIVFIDADCVPKDSWLNALIKPILNEGEKIVSGAVRPIGNNQIHKEEHYGKYRVECETMNVAIVKEVFNTVGLFDENMEGCEDSDLCIRARNKGYKIRFEPKAIVYHDWGGFIQNIKRSFNGGQDRVSLYKKYPEFIFTLTINNVYTWFYLLYVLLLPLAISFPYYILIVFIPSIIKTRNPLKELYNISFAIGSIVKTVKYIFKL